MYICIYIYTQYTSSAYTHNVLLQISAGPTMQVPSISSLSHVKWFPNATFGFDLSLYPASIYHHSLLMSYASFRCCYTSIPGATTCRRPVLGREVWKISPLSATDKNIAKLQKAALQRSADLKNIYTFSRGHMLGGFCFVYSWMIMVKNHDFIECQSRDASDAGTTST